MNKKYLLRFTPLEPYFLGGENTFRVDERSRYYANSLLIPTASTILGALRYMLLEQTGNLNANGKYTDAQKQVCDALIGPGSYCVGGANTFGKIKSISPVFLTDGREFYIKTPQNCQSACTQTQYRALTLGQQRYTTSFGSTIRFPLSGEYSSKHTVSEQSYMRLSDGKILCDLFQSIDRAGISKGKLENAYFKKTYTSLRSGFGFAVIAEFEEDISIRDTFCYMGRERSAFLLQATETDMDIEARIRACLAPRTDTSFYYVFGDTFVEQDITYTDFALLQTAYTRMLRSRIGSSLQITCTSEFYQLVRAGSVLYADDLRNGFETDFGYNRIIKIEV